MFPCPQLRLEGTIPAPKVGSRFVVFVQGLDCEIQSRSETLNELVGGDIQHDEQSNQEELLQEERQPTVGMMFENMEEARQYYVEYGKRLCLISLVADQRLVAYC
ncbi:hypothetical protein Drorol1_Dr00023226 [Drosera rotundifolia]